jgi:hypothetical protein
MRVIYRGSHAAILVLHIRSSGVLEDREVPKREVEDAVYIFYQDTCDQAKSNFNCCMSIPSNEDAWPAFSPVGSLWTSQSIRLHHLFQQAPSHVSLTVSLGCPTICHAAVEQAVRTLHHAGGGPPSVYAVMAGRHTFSFDHVPMVHDSRSHGTHFLVPPGYCSIDGFDGFDSVRHTHLLLLVTFSRYFPCDVSAASGMQRRSSQPPLIVGSQWRSGSGSAQAVHHTVLF